MLHRQTDGRTDGHIGTEVQEVQEVQKLQEVQEVQASVAQRRSVRPACGEAPGSRKAHAWDSGEKQRLRVARTCTHTGAVDVLGVPPHSLRCNEGDCDLWRGSTSPPSLCCCCCPSRKQKNLVLSFFSTVFFSP